jgi:hypothetical protein
VDGSDELGEKILVTDGDHQTAAAGRIHTTP